jgi:hypothetical protein
MDALIHRGSEQRGTNAYVHHCGAKVNQGAKNSWIARTVDGAPSVGYETAEQAMQWIESNDADFWNIGRGASRGNYFGLRISCGYLDSASTDHLVNWSLPDDPEIPKHLRAPFKKHFLHIATCARCGGQTPEIVLRSLVEFVGPKRGLITHVVCNCGYPVWRISSDACFKAENALKQAEYSRRRRESLVESGGKHNSREILEVLTFQENRCIYCNVPIAGKIRATRDHLIPVSYGGPDWALNIVIACRPCNSRRGTIPFRTYCRLLSPTQNRRILKSLGRRVAALDLDRLPQGAFASFCEGIALHNPRNPRYRLLLSISATARRYVTANQLLPCSPHLILRSTYGL